MKSVLPKAVRDLTYEFTRLPGVGPKTAQRLALHLLRQPEGVVAKLADTIRQLHSNVHICKTCFNLSESEICVICKDQERNTDVVCVVEDALDIDAIERTGSFNGRYHVLGGVLSPLEGVTVDQLTIQELFDRIQAENIKEIIIALDHNMESEATTRHIQTYLSNSNVSITRLARGLPTGGDIEFADALTISAAFDGRKKV